MNMTMKLLTILLFISIALASPKKKIDGGVAPALRMNPGSGGRRLLKKEISEKVPVKKDIGKKKVDKNFIGKLYEGKDLVKDQVGKMNKVLSKTPFTQKAKPTGLVNKDFSSARFTKAVLQGSPQVQVVSSVVETPREPTYPSTAVAEVARAMFVSSATDIINNLVSLVEPDTSVAGTPAGTLTIRQVVANIFDAVNNPNQLGSNVLLGTLRYEIDRLNGNRNNLLAENLYDLVDTLIMVKYLSMETIMSTNVIEDLNPMLFSSMEVVDVAQQLFGASRARARQAASITADLPGTRKDAILSDARGVIAQLDELLDLNSAVIAWLETGAPTWEYNVEQMRNQLSEVASLVEIATDEVLVDFLDTIHQEIEGGRGIVTTTNELLNLRTVDEKREHFISSLSAHVLEREIRVNAVVAQVSATPSLTGDQLILAEDARREFLRQSYTLMTSIDRLQGLDASGQAAMTSLLPGVQEDLSFIKTEMTDIVMQVGNAPAEIVHTLLGDMNPVVQASLNLVSSLEQGMAIMLARN